MLDRLAEMLAGKITPAWIAEKLLSQMKQGVSAITVADQLARIPGIAAQVHGQTPDLFWNTLMNDPRTKQVVHPFDRAALKKFIADVLTETQRRAIQ